MIGDPALVRAARLVAFALTLCAPPFSSIGSQATVMKTNWSDRWITNVIEVNMPINRFVNQYRTNWIPQFQTNWNMCTVTNLVVVEAFWTNTLVAYRTNLVMRMRTNHVAVNVLQTNVVNCYHTNRSVVYLTNWVAQSATNIVQVRAPSPSPPAALVREQPPALPEARIEPASSVSAVTWSGPLTIEAVRTALPAANNLLEVRMKVRWTAATTAPLQVQRWRVEREDAAILLFEQEQEFKRQLPPGKYKVEVRLKGQGDNTPPVARGTLSVTPQDAIVQPRLLVKK